MSDGGNAKKDRLVLIRADQKKQKQPEVFMCAFSSVLYFILCYVGISGFCGGVYGTTYCKDHYEETDTPWRLYCCARGTDCKRRLSGRFYSGGQCICYGYLRHNHHGGLEAFHCCSGHILGGIPGVFMDQVKNNTEKREAFLPSEKGIRMANLDEGLSEDCLPGLLPSILPLAVVLVLSAGFSGICSKGHYLQAASLLLLQDNKKPAAKAKDKPFTGHHCCLMAPF